MRYISEYILQNWMLESNSWFLRTDIHILSFYGKIVTVRCMQITVSYRGYATIVEHLFQCSKMYFFAKNSSFPESSSGISKQCLVCGATSFLPRRGRTAD